MDGIGAFFRELRRRKLFRTSAIYAGSAWVTLQVSGLAFPALGIRGEAIRYVWIGAFVGLPLALLFAWRYQITSRGLVRTATDPAGESDAFPLHRPDYLILGTMLLVAGGAGLHLVSQIRQLPAAARPTTPPGQIAPNSVAVLPLENVTGDPEQEHFVAGMQDALITDLGKIGGLVVKAGSSAEVYRNVVQPVRQTGLELRTAHVVEGSVFRTGDRMRLNVQLIATDTEESLWSESYERDIDDVLTLQAEVARAIAERVGVELTPDERRRLTSTRTVNPEVYETYLRGMYHLNRYTPEGVQQGLAYLHEAVDKDPQDPLAHAGLAQAYTMIGHGAHPPPGAFARARKAAVRALELDPLFPEAHAAMAEIQLYHDWDWEGAERSFRRALQLNPNLEFTHAHYGWYHQLLGDLDGAIEHMERAQQIAPVTPIFTAWVGWLYWADRDLDRAIAEAQKSLELNPTFPWGLYVLGGAYEAKGMVEEAVATHERLLEINPRLGRWGLGFTYAKRGRHADARRMAAALAEDPGQKDLMVLGLIHAVLGDNDEALRWLEAARDAHVDWYPFVGARTGFDAYVGAALDSLRNDPRYRRLVAPLEIPEPG